MLKLSSCLLLPLLASLQLGAAQHPLELPLRLVGGRAVGEEWLQMPRVQRAQATKTKTMPDHMLRVTKREKDWGWPDRTLAMFRDQTRDDLTKRTIMDPKPTWVKIRASKRILSKASYKRLLATRIGK